MQRMLKDRGYNASHEKVIYNERQKLLQLSTLTDLKERLLVVLTPVIHVPMQVSEVDDLNQLGDQSSSTIHADAKNSDNTKSTGSDFVKSLLSFCRSKKITRVVLVTDNISDHAKKELAKHSDIQVTFFSYMETMNPAMGRHVDQPMSIVKLKPTQKNEFIKKNPLYQKELAQYNESDILIRYMGLKPGDIFYVEENDNQSDFSFEYSIVVKDP